MPIAETKSEENIEVDGLEDIPWDNYSDLPAPKYYIEKENENELGRSS